MTGPSIRSLGASALLLVVSLALGCNDILGIGDPQLAPDDPGGSGGQGGVTGSGGEVSGGSGGGDLPGPCHPDGCTTVESDCLALEDNTGKSLYGLRVQQASIWKPDAFASGLEYAAISQAMTMSAPACYLAGGGTISWIIEFDEQLGQGRVGSAKPVTDPAGPYAFVDELIEVAPGVFWNVAPGIISASVDADGTITSTVIESLLMPLYLDQAATDFILMPVRKARLYDAKISADRNCIGSHNDFGLSPDNGCLPDLALGIKSFVDGSKLDGYIVLEEADDIIVTTFGLNRSLCVILAQDTGEFSDGGSPQRCARQQPANNIKFPGDWCSTTNTGATPSCHDAVYFGLAFAASGVIVDHGS